MNIRMPTDDKEEQQEGAESDDAGTRWALLVAGSKGFDNYRHQADVCHAYQVLKKGGLKDENIVVFMYDDIANNELNPRKGVIINHPEGDDVYVGVPKDYTGEQVNADNMYAVLLGDKNAVKGGSGKVIDSKPNDRIFIYYSDHGGPGVLGMPNTPYVYGKDFVEVLKKKHASKSYKEMVMYIEACESGSIFEGLMPEDLNIYATTAANSEESSWGTYCPGMDPAPPPEFTTCLGDLYSIAWMEDSQTHNLKEETIRQQYGKVNLIEALSELSRREQLSGMSTGLYLYGFMRVFFTCLVKERTSNYNTYTSGSHVMEYGNKSIKAEKLYLYQGFNPGMVNLPSNSLSLDIKLGVINQRVADLLFLWKRLEKSREDPEEKNKIIIEITETVKHRSHLDSSIELIGKLLFGPIHGPSVLSAKVIPGMPLVDDWDCLKSMVRVFEKECGSLTQYGMKHMRAFANICNEEIPQFAMEEASVAVCSGHNSGQWHPSFNGYSA